MKRDESCIGFKLDPATRKMFGQKAKPYKGCVCQWCIRAAEPEQQMTFAPVCECTTCKGHFLWHHPEHFLRICPNHGARWTAYDEPDPCNVCQIDEILGTSNGATL